MRRCSLLGAAAAASLLLTVSACSGNKDEKSEADIKKELSTTLQGDQTDLTKKQADCYAGLIIETVGIDELQDVDLSAKTPPDDIQVDVAAATLRAQSECGITEAGAGDG